MTDKPFWLMPSNAAQNAATSSEQAETNVVHVEAKKLDETIISNNEVELHFSNVAHTNAVHEPLINVVFNTEAELQVSNVVHANVVHEPLTNTVSNTEHTIISQRQRFGPHR